MPSGPKASEPAHFNSALPDFIPAVAAPKTVAAVSIAIRVNRMCSLQWFIAYHSWEALAGPDRLIGPPYAKYRWYFELPKDNCSGFGGSGLILFQWCLKKLKNCDSWTKRFFGG